jgi:hypothetical protein
MQDSEQQDSSTAATTRAGGGARQEPVMDRTMTMRVSRSARATHSPSFFLSSSFRSRVWSRAAKASALGGLSLTPLSSFHAPDIRSFAVIPSSDLPGLHLELLCDRSWKTRFHFYPIHSSSSPTRLFRHISFIRRVGLFEPCMTGSSRF